MSPWIATAAWGRSSTGRAVALQATGRRFDPDRLHQKVVATFWFRCASKKLDSMILITTSAVIETKIYMIRGQKVMLDSDLASLYGVETKMLNRAVRRNIDRFPDDFMFQPTEEEFEILRYQIGTLRSEHGQHRKYFPLVFTEQGIAMLSSVLSSKEAVYVNIQIMRAFVKIRELLLTHKDLARKLDVAVRRNIDRFPSDFTFQLSDEEVESLKCQIGISKTEGRGGRRTLPYAFTQEGIAMLSSVLRGGQAIMVNVQIMRAFVKIRELLLTHKNLARKLTELEKKYDHQFKIVFDAIRELMSERAVPRKQVIGLGKQD